MEHHKKTDEPPQEQPQVMETVGDNNLLGVMFILFFLMQIAWILRPTTIC